MEHIEKENIGQYQNLLEKFDRNPVIFLPEASLVSFEEVEMARQEFGANLMYACDFTIDGIERFEKDGYFQREKIINIDHHSESPNFKRYISSANLAIQFVKNHPDFLVDTRVLTHHVDCDSVLSTAIMSGVLQPEERFGVAAIAADHTGEANNIADLLQGIESAMSGEASEKSTSEQNLSKYLYSLEQLQNLLTGKELDEKAKEFLARRLEKRELLQNLIAHDQIKYVGENEEVAYMETDQEKFDATMLIGLLPNTKVIFTTRQVEEGKTIVNARLGKAIKTGTDLRDIMNAINEPFGGRWNAGANRRKGGTDSSAEDIAIKIAEYLKIKK